MTIRFLPPHGAPRRLAAGQFANSVGDGAYYVCSALYFTRAVGLSPAQTGLGLTVAWAIGSVAGVPLGALADRRGPRGTSAALAVATAVSVFAFLFIRSFWAFLAAVVVYATAQCGLAAARQALLAGLVPPERGGPGCWPISSRCSTADWRWAPPSAASPWVRTPSGPISRCSCWTA